MSFDAIQAAFLFRTDKHHVSERVIQDVELHLYVIRTHSLKHKKIETTTQGITGKEV
jgi:hypothetical protein